MRKVPAGVGGRLTGTDHERAFVEAFVDRAYRARWLSLLEMGKRDRLRERLAHHAEREIDARTVVSLSGADQYDARIGELLRTMSSIRTCWCLSVSSRIDGRELAVGDALACVVGMQIGTILSLESGALAYFEPEDGEGRRWILVKDPTRRERLCRFIAASAAENRGSS